MTKNKIDRGVELLEEIRKIDLFLLSAKKVWTGKLTLRNIISSAYGFISQKEFKMNTKIKNRVLAVLEAYQEELKAEMSKL